MQAIAIVSPVLAGITHKMAFEGKVLTKGQNDYIERVTGTSNGTLSTLIREAGFQFDQTHRTLYVYHDLIFSFWRDFVIAQLLENDVKFTNWMDSWLAFLANVHSPEDGFHKRTYLAKNLLPDFGAIYTVNTVVVPIDQKGLKGTLVESFQISEYRYIQCAQGMTAVEIEQESFDQLSQNNPYMINDSKVA